MMNYKRKTKPNIVIFFTLLTCMCFMLCSCAKDEDEIRYLRYGTNITVLTLNQFTMSDAGSGMVYRHLMDGLLILDEEGNAQPSLAKAMMSRRMG